MTVPTVSLTPRTDDGLGAGASAGAVLEWAARDDFHRWEAQLADTGYCASPIRLAGRIRVRFSRVSQDLAPLTWSRYSPAAWTRP